MSRAELSRAELSRAELSRVDGEAAGSTATASNVEGHATSEAARNAAYAAIRKHEAHVIAPRNEGAYIIKLIHYRYCRIYLYLITIFLNENSDYFNFVTTVLSYKMYCIRYSCLFHLCLSHKNGARILVQGNIGQNFIHEFLSRPVLQWRRQNFSSKGTFSKNVLIEEF